jgi:protein-disulfide isomerase
MSWEKYGIEKKDLLMPASILIGAILISLSICWSSGKISLSGSDSAAVKIGDTPKIAGSGKVVLSLNPNTPYLGKGQAKVTVVEYADYRCPFCEKFYTDVFSQLKSKYIDNGEIKFMYQDFAFLGPDSNTAAEATHCAADQNMFWQYHDYLFTHQGSESSDWASSINQKKFAQTLGLNTSQFNQCLDSGKYKQEVLNETDAGKKYGVTGTPSVFVNGQILVGAQPLVSFEQAIDAALK